MGPRGKGSRHQAGVTPPADGRAGSTNPQSNLKQGFMKPDIFNKEDLITEGLFNGYQVRLDLRKALSAGYVS